MKKLFTLFLFLIFGMAAFQEAEASHVMGSDIVYRCLGNGQYEVTLRVYRDCNGIQLGNTPVQARCASGSGSTINLNLPKISQRDITGIDASCPIQSRCSGSFQYGVEEHVWKGVVNLSSLNCCKVILSWSECCRNGNITTGPSGQNFWTSAELDKCVSPCNSSPDFTNPPVAIICHNQDYIFNNGALDTNDQGDSLSYSLVAGKQAQGQDVTYGGSFSPTRPLTFLGSPNINLNFPAGFRLDPETGDLMFRPTKANEVGIVVIEVKEWRKINGVWTEIGVTRRDMQIIVIPCPNNKTPTIKPPYTANFCEGTNNCIDIETTDPDNGDTVVVSWNGGIPGATFTNTNKQKRLATGKVCWTPTEADVSSIPYTFTITAKDDACPIPGQQIRAFRIYVFETPKAARNIQLLNCGYVKVDATPNKNNYPGLKYNWVIRDSLGNTVKIIPRKSDSVRLQPGRHIVTLNLETSTPCFNSHIDTIVVAPYVTVDIPTDTVYCVGYPMVLNAISAGGTTPYKWSWNGSTTDTLSTYTSSPDSTVTVRIKIKDNNGCENEDSTLVTYRQLPEINLGPDQRICFYENTILDAGNDTVNLKYLWSTGDTTRTIDINTQNNYWAKVTDSLGCYNSDTLTLNVNQVPVNAGPNIIDCQRDTVRITATGADSYAWWESGLSNTVLSNQALLSHIAQTDKIFVVRGIKTEGGKTCENQDTMSLSVNPLPQILLQTQEICEDLDNYNLNLMLASGTPQGGVWSSSRNSNWVLAGALFKTLTAGPNTTPGHILTYVYTDGNGCVNRDSINLRVNPKPILNLVDTAVCADRGLVNLNSIFRAPTPAPGNGVPTWENTALPQRNAIAGNPFAGYTFNLSLVNPGNSYPIIYKFTDFRGCTNSDTAIITSKLVPTVDAGFASPVCEDVAPINLNSIPGRSPAGGTWTSSIPNLITSDSIFNPANAPNKNNVNYFFRYTFVLNGCAAFDSVGVLVKPLPVVDVSVPNVGNCITAPEFNLIGSPTPVGSSVFAGSGVTGNRFNPSTAGPGWHLVTYTYTSPATQCTNDDTVNIFVQEQPDIQISSNSTDACEGIPFTLNSTVVNAGGIQWTSNGDGSFSSNSSPNTTYTPGPNDNANKGFSISGVTTQNGYCPAETENLNITIYPIPTAVIASDKINGCEPLDINFQGITDADPATSTFEWTFGDGNTSTQQNPQYVFNNDGSYVVNFRVTSVNGCERQAVPLGIEVWPMPEAAMDASRWRTTVAMTEINFFDRSSLTGAGSIAQYEWSFGDPDNSTSSQRNPTFEYPTDTGSYFVVLRVVTNNGCEDTTGRLLVVDPDITVFIPNAFTPNGFGEGKNNRFWVTADGFETFNIQIFSRWGEMVYESNKIKEGWDGNFKGEPAQQDVYTYLVKVTNAKGKEFVYYGTVTLLR